jgi:GLPGLI family protein
MEGWVADLRARQVLHLFTFGGKKLLRRSNLSRDPKAIAAEGKKLVYTRETRTILGYPCRKVLYQAGDTAELWVTDQIPLGVSPVYFHLVDGVVLEAKTGRSRYLATEIILQKPEAALFDYAGREETNRTIEQKIVSACY